MLKDAGASPVLIPLSPMGNESWSQILAHISSFAFTISCLLLPGVMSLGLWGVTVSCCPLSPELGLR